MKPDNNRSIPIVLALLLPFIVCWVQWQFWSVIKPYAWFLFFPTVFFSSRIGGKTAGLISTVTSALLVVYFFIPPQFSFIDKSHNNLYSVLIFLVMGYLFSYTHDRLEQANRQAAEAQEAVRSANRQLQEARFDRLQTEQQRTAGYLQKSEDRFRVVLDNAADAVFVATQTGSFTYANNHAVQMLALGREELLAKGLFDIVPPDEAGQAKATFEQLKQAGYLSQEMRLLHRDGIIVPVELNAVALPDGTFFAACRDISAKKQAEETLRQALKMEAVGQLAGGVAHDYNNILQVIMGHAQLQSMYNEEHGLKTHYLDEIFKAVERGAALTRSLLVFCRKQPVELTLFDLNVLVTESHKLAMRLVTEEIAIILELCDQPLNIRGDSSLVQNVVFNLVTNARDAILRQGRITISTGMNTISGDVTATHGAAPQEGRYALLTVTDTGCGISNENRDKIFEPFFTTKEVGKGTGLGLSMIYGTIRQMGGFIVVESQPGAGSAITIHIPLTDENVEFPDRSNTHTGKLGNNELLLIVEDEEGVCNSLAQILTISDYRVLCAADGSEAIKLARENSSELKLVIMDMILPDMDGIEAAGKLYHITPDLPILFLSGYGDENLDLRGITGCYLNKPAHPVQLLKHVHLLLQESRTKERNNE